MNKENTTNPGWILITGGSKGIGKSIVETLSENYEVVFTYLSSAEPAKVIEHSMAELGRKASGYQCDGRDYQQVEKLCNELIASKGAPLALVNNMGIARDESMLSLQIDNYQDTIASNLDSSIYFSKCVSAAMVEAGVGSIIFMSSVAGLKGNAGQVSYSATKAAMIGVAKPLSLELARFGITVNCIAPGFINTDMMEDIPQSALAKIKKSIPLRRLGDAKEVASLARYLISDSAQYITGQTFTIDGGLTA